jgi:hypothetical protein
VKIIISPSKFDINTSTLLKLLFLLGKKNPIRYQENKLIIYIIFFFFTYNLSTIPLFYYLKPKFIYLSFNFQRECTRMFKYSISRQPIRTKTTEPGRSCLSVVVAVPKTVSPYRLG